MKNNHKARIFSILVIFSMLLGALGMPNSVAHAAAVVEGTPTVYSITSTTSNAISFAHTAGTGTDRLMLVGVSWNSNTNDSPITSVTFSYGVGPTVLTLNPVIARKNSAVYRYAAIYSLVNPPSGEAGTVTVTFANSVGSGIIAGATNFTGVDTTTPLGSPTGADATGTAISVTVPGLAGDELVFDTVFLGGTSPTITVDPSQSQLWNATVSNARGAGSTEQAAGSSVVMSWTGGASGPWVDIAVPIFPACTGSRYTLTANSDGHGAVTLNPVGGSYCSGRSVTLTPVPNSGYLFSGWVGTNASEIQNTAGVYTIVMNGNKSVTANFVPQACQDASPLNVDDDTYLSAANTTFNYGGATSLQVDGTTGTSRRTALLRWTNLSSIPTGATVSSASIQLQVTDASTIAYPLYDLAKVWVEGTNTGAAGTGASWTYYDAGTTAWTTAGAASVTGSVDRGGTNLWSSTTSSFSSLGSAAVVLNADGVAVVQRWVAGGTNNGVIIQQYSGATNTLFFDSAEGTTPPRLNINYCLPNNTAPAQPVLVSPTPSGATGVSTSPTLEVTVSDTDANPTNVTFYGREVGAGTWQNLGTAYAVSSGANATMSWPGLTVSTPYEWYVTVNDGPATTTGATWSFTTVVPTFTLTYTAGTGGTITAPATSPTTHNSGAVVTITAAPNTGYHFVNWTGDVGTVADVNAASTTITMNGNYAITANFAINTYTLTYTAGTGGTITAPATSPTTHNSGAVVTITAAPNTGYHFVNWTGDVGTVADVNAASTTITMNGSYAITANFAINTYTLTAGNDGHGTVTLSPAGGTYASGTTVTLTPVPSSGYKFSSWSGANAGEIVDTGGVYTIVMNGNKSVTANFTINTYTLTYTAGTGGTITAPATSPSTHNSGAVVTITAAPTTGYHFVNWMGDVGTVADVNAASTTITMNGNYNIAAHFAINIYYIYLPIILH